MRTVLLAFACVFGFWAVAPDPLVTPTTRTIFGIAAPIFCLLAFGARVLKDRYLTECEEGIQSQLVGMHGSTQVVQLEQGLARGMVGDV